MIIGNGMLARSFHPADSQDVTFFCSGVADSSSKKKEDFLREQRLLSSMPSDKLLIYTSTLSAAINETPYQKHKLFMESLVRKFPRYLIYRVGNLVGSSQKASQFFPSIVRQIKEGRIYVRRCHRDLLAVHDYVEIVSRMVRHENATIRLCSAAPPLVIDIVEEIEGLLSIQCKKEFLPDIEPFVFEADLITGPADYYKEVVRGNL